MAAMASPLGKTVEESLRTSVGARPRLWTTVTWPPFDVGLITSGGGRAFVAILGGWVEVLDGLDGKTFVGREVDGIGSGSGPDRVKGRRKVICERR
jgi:hypothetical protein